MILKKYLLTLLFSSCCSAPSLAFDEVKSASFSLPGQVEELVTGKSSKQNDSAVESARPARAVDYDYLGGYCEADKIQQSARNDYLNWEKAKRLRARKKAEIIRQGRCFNPLAWWVGDAYLAFRHRRAGKSLERANKRAAQVAAATKEKMQRFGRSLEDR